MKWVKEYKDAVANHRRRLVGYWSVDELARFLGVTTTAILMQVRRGQLTPVDDAPRQPVYFTDAEVNRYLSVPYRGGRKRRKPEPDGTEPHGTD